MGAPILDPKLVPTKLSPTINGAVVNAPIEISGSSFSVTAVSMGNPHAVTISKGNHLLFQYIIIFIIIFIFIFKVIFVDDLTTMSPPFQVLGPSLESHLMFPQRVNAEFVQVRLYRHLCDLPTYCAQYKMQAL